ncbi:hypothetical protein LSF60_05520 [Rhodococcus pyridinivorans]|uniref:hypothetical protein n=1 Tax=Rhodococcus pyridinivorans TaxID=103816 RepID=UPI001E40F2CE|nr:hypothetical protein [Rhodococcus pyridinivorans]UGQ58971.1 hypothetical protein LSF60_05520 [Rhodococcus pyridinivorans]
MPNPRKTIPTETGSTTGRDLAIAGAHRDLLVVAEQWIAHQPSGTTFTAAQMALYLPPHANDKPCRLGALVRELNRRGYIEFHGYGPRAAEGDWDAPARVWRRTDMRVGGEAA